MSSKRRKPTILPQWSPNPIHFVRKIDEIIFLAFFLCLHPFDEISLARLSPTTFYLDLAGEPIRRTEAIRMRRDGPGTGLCDLEKGQMFLGLESNGARSI